MALNCLNITEEAQADANQLLNDSVEKLERQVAVLMGKKPNSIILLWKISNNCLEDHGGPVQGNLYKMDSVNEGTKRSDFEVPFGLDLFEI